MADGDVKHWLARFDAIERADLQAAADDGADRAASIRLSLSMIVAAGRSALDSAAGDPVRAEEDAAVRRTWQRLRDRLVT